LAGAFGLVLAGLGVSALVGGIGAQSTALSAPHLSVLMYAAEESTAEFYFSDSFGNIAPEQVHSLPVSAGVNNLTVDVSAAATRDSYAQRFDPCTCETPILLGEVRLETRLYSERLPASLWAPAGDLSVLRTEGSGFRLQTAPGASDPQLIIYADISSFAERAQAVAFWTLFGLSSAGITVSVGLGAGIQSRGRRRRAFRSPYLASRRTMYREPKIPLALSAFLAAVGVIALTQQILGAWTIGVTIDEPAHVAHLSSYFDSGVYSSSVYGPATSLFGHVLNVTLGYEVWGAPLASAEAYQVRHLAVSLIGAVGLLAVGMSSWLIFGSIRWALLAIAVLGSMPVWVGHSMFNIKDVPVATGYTLVTAGLIAALSRELKGWRKFSAVFVPLVLGVAIGVGTRPGALALMVGSGAVAAILWFVFHSTMGSVRKRLMVAGITLGTSLLAIASVLAFTEPGRRLMAGIERSLDYPWTGFNLYAGELVNERPGAAVIAMVFASYLPLFTLLLVVAGVIFGLIRLVQAMLPGSDWSLRESAFVLVSAQAGVGFAALVVANPVIYDGGRQLLFAFPAFALLSVFGVYALLKALPYVSTSRRSGRGIVTAVIVVAFSIVTVDQLRFFPYNYSYYNEIAQGPGISGRWETDYWGASAREGARFVAPDDPAICGLPGTHNFGLGPNFPDSCGLLLPYVGTAAQGEQSVLTDGEFWVIRSDRTLLNHGPIRSNNCRLHHEVTRPLRGEDVVMSRVYICADE
jgi:hypothetical protein